MRLRTKALSPLIFCFASCASAAEESRCVTEYMVEEARIIHEAEIAAKEHPPGKDPESQRGFMTPIHNALKAAADKADKCEDELRRNRPESIRNAEAAREQACTDNANAKLNALRSTSDTDVQLSREEQTSLRNKENAILDERMECLQKARPIR